MRGYQVQRVTAEDAARPFLKIQDAVAVTGLSAYFLRQGCRDGSIPCVQSGKKYYINIPALLKKLGVTENGKEN